MKEKIIKSILKFNLKNIDIYLFGSTIKYVNKFSDIDLLIVYENQEDLKHFKKLILTHSQSYPIDMIFLTRAEENELNFIQKTQAILLNKFCKEHFSE